MSIFGAVLSQLRQTTPFTNLWPSQRGLIGIRFDEIIILEKPCQMCLVSRKTPRFECSFVQALFLRFACSLVLVQDLSRLYHKALLYLRRFADIFRPSPQQLGKGASGLDAKSDRKHIDATFDTAKQCLDLDAEAVSGHRGTDAKVNVLHMNHIDQSVGSS